MGSGGGEPILADWAAWTKRALGCAGLYNSPMGTRILIDGYNLIAELWGMGADRREIARQRGRLIALLVDYRSVRDYPVHVVFDGWKDGDPMGGHDREEGIEISYSPLRVTADEVIRDLVARRGPGTLVISSDRRVQGWARQAGADAVDSARFAARLQEARSMLSTDFPEFRDEEDDGWDGSTVKKGNPHRRSKRDRAVHQRLKKL